MGVHEDTLYLLAGQKRPKDDYKDTDVLHKVNKDGMVGTMKAIEYLRSCHDVVTAPLAYIIWKMMIVQTYGDYSKHAECYIYS